MTAIRSRGTSHLSVVPSNGSHVPECYRDKERQRIISSVLAGSGILVAGKSGSGKTKLAEFVTRDLKHHGYTVVEIHNAPEKQILTQIANQLGISLRDIEGKRKLTSADLKENIQIWLRTHTTILICDDTDIYPVAFRRWLKELVHDQQPMALFATNPLRRDVFSKLPELILEPLPELVIRTLIQKQIKALQIRLSPSEITTLVYQSGGNPDEAQRLVRAQHLGIRVTPAEDDDTLDATPFVVGLITGLAVLRLLGLAYNNQMLYIGGGILGIFGIILRQSLNRLPKRSKRIGGSRR